MKNWSFSKKASVFGLAVLMVLSIVLAGCGNSGGNSGQFTLGAGSQGGVYYPVGVGIAEILTKNMEGVTVTPEVTGASLENAVLLGNQEVEMAILTAGDLVAGLKGEKPFEQKIDNVSVMFAGLKPGAVQVLTLKDNGIKSIEDLKGKKVALGPQGGSGWKAFAEILPYYNMSLEDVNASYISYGDSIEQLTDKTIDATVVTAGAPTPAVVQLATQSGMAFVPFDEAKLKKFLDEHPYYIASTIKKELYKGLEQDVNTYATVNVVAVSDSVDEEMVYNMLKTLYGHVEDFRKVHPTVQKISVESAGEFKGFRYHEGAAKFFKENGIEVPTE